MAVVQSDTEEEESSGDPSGEEEKKKKTDAPTGSTQRTATVTEAQAVDPASVAASKEGGKRWPRAAAVLGEVPGALAETAGALAPGAVSEWAYGKTAAGKEEAATRMPMAEARSQRQEDIELWRQKFTELMERRRAEGQQQQADKSRVAGAYGHGRSGAVAEATAPVAEGTAEAAASAQQAEEKQRGLRIKAAEAAWEKYQDRVRGNIYEALKGTKDKKGAIEKLVEKFGTAWKGQPIPEIEKTLAEIEAGETDDVEAIEESEEGDV